MKRLIILRKIFIYAIAVAIGYTSLLIFLGNPGKGILKEGITKDIMLRRNFLIKALSGKPKTTDFFQAKDMQFAGEWAIGTYSMATYALTNIAMLEPETAHESSQIIAEWIGVCMDEEVFAFDQIAWWEESPLSPEALSGDRGHIGYYGHLNLMLGCYALLNNDGQFELLHRKISDAIARRMLKYPHRHVETYPYETYPPDNTVAVVSLRVADMTLDTDYSDLIDEWILQSKLLEAKPYGLIVFQINSFTGEPFQSCRGSNIAWNSFFLPLVDEEYADEQFERFREFMLRRIPGFATFKEYPEGNLFKMDCDTGPVIFGVGGTATGFSVAGARWTKDERLLTELLRSVELLGTSVTKGDMRRYIVSPIVGDAIMLSVKTACRWRPLWKPKE